MNHKFYKLLAITELMAKSASIKSELLNDLISQAPDDVIFMRRFRILAQVCEYEQQVIKKIYQFQTDCIFDYTEAVNEIHDELLRVSSINA